MKSTSTATGNLPLSGGTLIDSSGTPLTLRGTSGQAYLKYKGYDGTDLGYLGFDSANNPVVLTGGGNTLGSILHTGNVGDYALPKSGGRIESTAAIPFEISSIGQNYEESYHRYYANGKELGGFGYYGVKNPCVLLGNVASSIVHANNVGEYALIKNGGTANNITLKNAASGYGMVYKNHTDTTDYGTYLKDFDADGNEAGICIHAQTNDVSYKSTNGTWHDIHHDGNSAKVAIQSTAPTDTSALWVY